MLFVAWEFWKSFFHNHNRHISKRTWILITFCSFVALCYLQQILFGFGATRIGGLLGRFVDNTVRRSCFEHEASLLERRFEATFGYRLPKHPDPRANKVGVHVLLNNYIVHSMMHIKSRRDAIEHHDSAGCELRIIHPLVGDWYRPVEWKLPGNHTGKKLSALYFDSEQMDDFMMEHFRDLHRSSYQRLSLSKRVQIFGLASVYIHGGIFVSPEVSDSASLMEFAPGLQTWLEQLDCPKMMDETSTPSMWYQSINTNSVGVLAATPRHPTVSCVIREERWNDFHHLLKHDHWDPYCQPRCCVLAKLPPDEANVVLSNVQVPVANDERERFLVSIKEQVDTSEPFLRPKERISAKLKRGWCSPGWACNRCLRMPFRGSLQACRWVCRPCYQQHVCVRQEYKTVTMEVTVVETKHSTKKRIPPIIHQTWFEPLTTARYPHLQRLQNSWKAAGWKYRFYSDNDCVTFIQENYPNRFVEAFKAILPGAFKADFFRLLVLFKEGGVYADVDVQLEANLDQFISKDMSLFIPRDSPLDYWPDSNYFLWNGLMGAAPGHPILAKAIEDILTKILNRADYYDVEGSLCSDDLDTKIWKLRTLPVLILTGPCALGMSVNEVLGNEDLMRGYDIGWLPAANFTEHSPPDMFWGHGLILLADKHDLGEMRFTDVERNLVVATTNIDRIANSPIAYGDSRVPKKKLVHYSKGETDIVGEIGVYADDKVTGERVKLRITHEYR